MKKAVIAGGTLVVVIIVLGAAGYRSLKQDPRFAPAPPAAITPPTTPATTETLASVENPEGLLYGRITAADGATYEGRLRWGEEGDQEAFWGDYFSGSKRENLWLAHVPPERRPKERHAIEVFGLKVAEREGKIQVRRQLMARFGEIARIEASGRDVRVTLKSGTVFELDRFEAGDLDDGLRVWDGTRGAVDLDSMQLRTIELLPAPTTGTAPYRLHGTVKTSRGDFTGFIQWDRDECIGTDKLDGHTTDGELSVQFDTIRSIARRSSGDGSLVTLLDGREIPLSGTNDVDDGNRGTYVDDPRYGRVLISWDVLERVDFNAGGSGPAYGDFPPGRPLEGSVTTRTGSRHTGRLVFDLDESETTETLDVPTADVDYTIPFGLIASIAPTGGDENDAKNATVTLHSGEELRLERTGDLAERNAGMLIFVEGAQRPEYVPWADIERIDFERPPAMYPRSEPR